MPEFLNEEDTQWIAQHPLDVIRENDAYRMRALNAIEGYKRVCCVEWNALISSAMDHLKGSSTEIPNDNPVTHYLNVIASSFAKSTLNVTDKLLPLCYCDINKTEIHALASPNTAPSVTLGKQIDFMISTEEYLRSRQGIPYKRPLLPSSIISLSPDAYTELEDVIQEYPEGVPPVIIHSSDDGFENCFQKLFAIRGEIFDQRNKQHLAMRRIFRSGIFTFEYEGMEYQLLSWRSAKMLYSYSESTLRDQYTNNSEFPTSSTAIERHFQLVNKLEGC